MTGKVRGPSCNEYPRVIKEMGTFLFWVSARPRNQVQYRPSRQFGLPYRLQEVRRATSKFRGKRGGVPAMAR